MSEFITITAISGRITSQMPAGDSVVEVKTRDGWIVRAWYDCNIMDAGDWEFLPADESGEPIEDASPIDVVAWRYIRSALTAARYRILAPGKFDPRPEHRRELTGAREIIATSTHSHACDGGYRVVGGSAADAAISALTAAGYRILAPGELDPVALKKAAETVEQALQTFNWPTAQEIAAAIRALNTGGE